MLFCYSNSSYRFLAPDAWANSQPANMAQIQDLEVQCEKDLFRVRIKFDRPFYGMVFSKGFYSNVNCVHVPAGLGQTQATFDIAMGQVREQTCKQCSVLDFHCKGAVDNAWNG